MGDKRAIVQTKERQYLASSLTYCGDKNDRRARARRKEPYNFKDVPRRPRFRGVRGAEDLIERDGAGKVLRRSARIYLKHNDEEFDPGSG